MAMGIAIYHPALPLLPWQCQNNDRTVLDVAVKRRPEIATIITMIDVSRVSKQHGQHFGRQGQYNK